MKRNMLILAGLGALATVLCILDRNPVSSLISTATAAGGPNVTIQGPLPLPVSNTAASPVFAVNLDEPGRIPYQSTVSQTGMCSGNQCFFEFGNVPPGHRIVVQHISGLVTLSATPAAVIVTAQNGSGISMMDFLAPIAGSNSAFDQDILFYVDAAQLIEVQVISLSAAFDTGGGTQHVTLTGYSLDCVAVACTAIAH